MELTRIREHHNKNNECTTDLTQQNGTKRLDNDNSATTSTTVPNTTTSTICTTSTSAITATAPSAPQEERQCNDKRTTTKDQHDTKNRRQQPAHSGYTRQEFDIQNISNDTSASLHLHIPRKDDCTNNTNTMERDRPRTQGVVQGNNACLRPANVHANYR